MTRKYRCLYAIVLLVLLCFGCAQRDEPNDSEDAVATLEAVDSNNQETVAASIQPDIGISEVESSVSLAELLAADPNSYAINKEIAFYYLGRGDKDKAIQYFKRSFELNPNQPDVAGELGRLGAVIEVPK